MAVGVYCAVVLGGGCDALAVVAAVRIGACLCAVELPTVPEIIAVAFATLAHAGRRCFV